MARYVALLRAINAGAGRTIKMEPLRQLFESLGFSMVTTFIASGNVVFEATTQNARSLEKRIEERLREALGYEVAAFIRSDAELAEIANYKPFPPSKIDAATELNIVFLAANLDAKSIQKVRALRTDTDEFHIHGREIYWLRRKKPGGDNFSSVPLGKALGKPFTIRSANTVKRLVLKYAFARS